VVTGVIRELNEARIGVAPIDNLPARLFELVHDNVDAQRHGGGLQLEIATPSAILETKMKQDVRK
jgi:hypothetical protein